MQRRRSWSYLDTVDVSLAFASVGHRTRFKPDRDSPATMTEESIKTFGTSTPMGRAGQPVEIATCFVFLASADSSYIRLVNIVSYSAAISSQVSILILSYSGQVLHVNGGTVIN